VGVHGYPILLAEHEILAQVVGTPLSPLKLLSLSVCFELLGSSRVKIDHPCLVVLRGGDNDLVGDGDQSLADGDVGRVDVAGDVKLAHSILNDIRKLVEVLVRYAPKMKGANLQDLIGLDEAAQRRDMEQLDKDLIDLINQFTRSAAAKPTVDQDDELDASDETETLPEAPPRPASSPTDKPLGPLTGFE